MKIERNFVSQGDLDLQPNESISVLVVDDSKVQLRILSSLVKKMGFHVVAAASGRAALDACKTNNFTIIISDWMMPDMDGLALCRAIRETDTEEYLYFILLTSKGEKADIAEGLDAGADDFLTKPVNGSELRARMKAGQRIVDMQRELRATLQELRGLYDAVDRDLVEARKLQHSLIREPVQEFGGSTVRLFLQSSGRVGGDLVGTYPINATHVGIYSIDVSGHGVASALLSARLAGYLSSTSPDQNIALRRDGAGYVAIPPSEVVSTLNELILNEIETEHYFTIALAHINLLTGNMVFCQAGHPHPVVQRPNRTIDFLGDGGLPVGLLPNAVFSDVETTLGPGSRVLLYSDGITECENHKGELLDEQGLRVIMYGLTDLPGDEFYKGLIQGLSDHCDRTEFDDDVSAVLFEWPG